MTFRREYHKWETCHLIKLLKMTSMIICPWIRAFAMAQHGPTMTKWIILSLGGKATTHHSSTALTIDKLLKSIRSSSTHSTIRCMEQRLATSSRSSSIPCTRESKVNKISNYITRCTSLSTRHNSMKCRRVQLNPVGGHKMLQSNRRREQEPNAPLEARWQLPQLRVRTRSAPRRAQRRPQWNETKFDCREYYYFLKTKNIDIR